MVSESMTVSASIYLKQQFNYDVLTVAMFLAVVAFLVVPASYFISYLFKEYQERKVIFILCIISVCCCFMLLSLPFFEIDLLRFYLFFTILYIVSNVLESFTSALLAKIFPPNLSKRIGLCNAGFTIIFSTTGGKLSGAVVVTIIGLFGTDNLGNKIYGMYLIMFGLLSVAVYHKYSDLRIKAIARIIQRKNL